MDLTVAPDRHQRVVLNGSHSKWLPVRSGVSQGSVLGPVLFVIYINDIDEGLCSELLKFADDTKLFRHIKSKQDADKLQADLRRLYKWSTDWLMLFNADKCVHYEYNNPQHKYFMGDEGIGTSCEEEDLGLLINDKLDVSSQCAKAAKKANSILGMMSRSIK